MRIFTVIANWLALRRARRRWRDLQVILILVLLCALFNACSLGCGLTGYTLQQLGLLPTSTPTPSIPQGQEGSRLGLENKPQASNNLRIIRWCLY